MSGPYPRTGRSSAAPAAQIPRQAEQPVLRGALGQVQDLLPRPGGPTRRGAGREGGHGEERTRLLAGALEVVVVARRVGLAQVQIQVLTLDHIEGLLGAEREQAELERVRIFGFEDRLRGERDEHVADVDGVSDSILLPHRRPPPPPPPPPP